MSHRQRGCWMSMIPVKLQCIDSVENGNNDYTSEIQIVALLEHCAHTQNRDHDDDKLQSEMDTE